MPKKPTTAAAAAAPARPGGISGVHKLAMAVAAVVLLPMSLPTLTLLFFAMLPTMAAALVDRGPHRYAWLCVGGLNFAGATPYLFELWFVEHTVDHAFVQLGSVLALLVIYGAAGLGWLLHMAMPPAVSAFLQVAAQRRVAVLRAQQKKLVDLWGPDVKDGPAKG